MTVVTAQISESVQTLIDSRLDTIDRMLLGRVSRQERLAIVTEVESQIHELLEASDAEDLTREDVLAVLARLDPPEAYIPDEIEGQRVSLHSTIPARERQSGRAASYKIGRAAGVLGVSALALLLLLPVEYLIAAALKSEVVAEILLIGTLLVMFIAGVLGLTFGIIARKSGPSALVGIVTSSLALVLSVAMVIVGILLI
jgi:hypothetical protein